MLIKITHQDPEKPVVKHRKTLLLRVDSEDEKASWLHHLVHRGAVASTATHMPSSNHQNSGDGSTPSDAPEASSAQAPDVQAPVARMIESGAAARAASASETGEWSTAEAAAHNTATRSRRTQSRANIPTRSREEVRLLCTGCYL